MNLGDAITRIYVFSDGGISTQNLVVHQLDRDGYAVLVHGEIPSPCTDKLHESKIGVITLNHSDDRLDVYAECFCRPDDENTRRIQMRDVLISQMGEYEKLIKHKIERLKEMK